MEPTEELSTVGQVATTHASILYPALCFLDSANAFLDTARPQGNYGALKHRVAAIVDRGPRA